MQDFKALFHNLRSECTTRSLIQEHQNLTIMLLNGYLGHMAAYDSMLAFINASKPSDTVLKATNELIELYETTAPHMIVGHIIKVSQKHSLLPREEQAMLDRFDAHMGVSQPQPFTQEDIDNL